MTRSLLIILDRKAFEEQLATRYWDRPACEQIEFLRSTGQEVAGDLRQAISDAVAGMSDLELGARCQMLMMSGELLGSWAHVAVH